MKEIKGVQQNIWWERDRGKYGERERERETLTGNEKERDVYTIHTFISDRKGYRQGEVKRERERESLTIRCM